VRAYLDLVRRILDEGEVRPNRTGVDTLATPGATFEHDMADGFPLLTTKQVAYKLVRVELEGFIYGITTKKWYRDLGCHIWDDWCRPDKVPYAHDDETRAKMAAELDLGPIYGWQWRNFGATYPDWRSESRLIGMPIGRGVDQLSDVVRKLHESPDDRRMVVSAWNPVDVPKMALPPCHWGFQVLVIGGRLHLTWVQRSVDVALGLPFNVASYATLLHLLALEGGFREGRLIGFLGDTHVYLNHVEGLRRQLEREPLPLPRLETAPFQGIFGWRHEDTRVVGYEHRGKIAFEVAV